MSAKTMSKTAGGLVFPPNLKRKPRVSHVFARKDFGLVKGASFLVLIIEHHIFKLYASNRMTSLNTQIPLLDCINSYKKISTAIYAPERKTTRSEPARLS